MAKKQKAKSKQVLKQNRSLQPAVKIVASVLFALAVATAGALFVYFYFPSRGPKLPSPPLRDLAALHGVDLGVHITSNRLGERPYRDIVTSQFSFLTIDGEAHWIPLRPTSTQYNYGPLDKVVSFAAANHLPVQAHHLVWGEPALLPDWLKNGRYTKQQLEGMLHDDITNVAGHYKRRVAAWTVVNEAFTRAQHIYGLHDWWADKLGGTGYIDDAFRWARAADPSAKRILNDFYNETESSVSNAEYNYVVAARTRGVPIDAVGIQLHVDASRPPNKAAMIRNIQRFAAIGVPVYITEFDINSRYVKGDAAYKSRLEAQITADVTRACVESKGCVSFDVFGVTQRQSFLKRLTDARSYMFSDRYQPTSSFDAFRSAWLQPGS